MDGNRVFEIIEASDSIIVQKQPKYNTSKYTPSAMQVNSSCDKLIIFSARMRIAPSRLAMCARYILCYKSAKVDI